MHFYESIPMRLRHTYLTIHRRAQNHFAQFGVTADQYVLLSLLADEDGITQKEISARMCSDGNTITAMIRLLEGKGLIQREHCTIDRRARRVHLTKAGSLLQERLIASARSMHERMNDVVAGYDPKMFFDCLDQLAEVMADPDKPEATREYRKRDSNPSPGVSSVK